MVASSLAPTHHHRSHFGSRRYLYRLGPKLLSPFMLCPRAGSRSLFFAFWSHSSPCSWATHRFFAQEPYENRDFYIAGLRSFHQSCTRRFPRSSRIATTSHGILLRIIPPELLKMINDIFTSRTLHGACKKMSQKLKVQFHAKTKRLRRQPCS